MTHIMAVMAQKLKNIRTKCVKEVNWSINIKFKLINSCLNGKQLYSLKNL